MSDYIKSTSVAKINNIDIVVIENGEKRVAIKPICQILGVDPDWQNARIKEDEILGQLHKISYATGADGKRYEMATIPFQYVFGWLFSINPKKVSENVKDGVVRYKKECYDALYKHFTRLENYERKRAEMIKDASLVLETERQTFREARNRVAESKKELQKAWDFDFDEYMRLESQTTIDFPDHT